MLAQGQMVAGIAGHTLGWRVGQEQELTDERLVALMAEGESWALSKLYDRYVRLVFSVAYKSTQDRASAEEIVQEVFTKIWRRARDYQPGRGRFSSWLIGITQNHCIDELRRRRARPVLESTEDETMLGAATQGDPGEALEHAFDRARIARALEAIPPKQRAVIEMAFFEGLSHPEIASLCGDPVSTVKTRLRLGMQKLKGLLSDGEEV